MTHRTALTLLLAFTLLATGCDKKAPAPSASESAPAAADKAPKPAAKWEKDTTKDCPTHLMSAVIKLEDVDNGYAVTVTSKDKTDASFIRDHARYMQGASKYSNPPEDGLKFARRLGNRNNNCPIILSTDTVVTAEDVPQGARLTVIAKDPKNLDPLRKKAKTTLAVLREMKAGLRKALQQ